MKRKNKKNPFKTTTRGFLCIIYYSCKATYQTFRGLSLGLFVAIFFKLFGGMDNFKLTLVFLCLVYGSIKENRLKRKIERFIMRLV